jgi:hypothetical protein
MTEPLNIILAPRVRVDVVVTVKPLHVPPPLIVELPANRILAVPLIVPDVYNTVIPLI